MQKKNTHTKQETVTLHKYLQMHTLQVYIFVQCPVVFLFVFDMFFPCEEDIGNLTMSLVSTTNSNWTVCSTRADLSRYAYIGREARVNSITRFSACFRQLA